MLGEPRRGRAYVVAGLVAGLVIALSAIAAPAGAFVRHDGNDARGPLDLKKVSLTVKHHHFVAKFHTYAAFDYDALVLGFHDFGVEIRFGTHWRSAAFATADGKGYGTVCTYHPKSGKLDHCGHKKQIRITHPNAHTLKAVFPVKAVHKGLHSFRTSMGSFTDHNHGCPQSFCHDRVPNGLHAYIHDHT